jgi:hypothetical protein
MRDFMQRSLVVAMAFLLSACASAPGKIFSGVVTPEKDQGDVYLYRTSAIFATATSFGVTLNGERVGDLYNASYLHLRLPAGKYTVKVSPGGLSKTSELQIEPELGKSSFFQYDFTTGPLANMFFVGSSIQPRTQERALLDLAELKSAK